MDSPRSNVGMGPGPHGRGPTSQGVMRLRSMDHPKDLQAKFNPSLHQRGLHTGTSAKSCNASWHPRLLACAWQCHPCPQPGPTGHSTDGINKTYESCNEKKSCRASGVNPLPLGKGTVVRFKKKKVALAKLS